MRLTLTLRDPAGETVLERTITIDDPRKVFGATGQEVWDMFSAASTRVASPIGLTLAVTEADDAGPRTLATRAAAMIAAARRSRGTRR